MKNGGRVKISLFRKGFVVAFVMLLGGPVLARGNNYRCWADPGFHGVLKFDLENNLACVTGFGGQNYDCKRHGVEVLPIVHVQDGVELIFGQKIAIKTIRVQSSDMSREAELKIYMLEFSRPYFGHYLVLPADLKINKPFWPYEHSWQSFPDGQFQPGELYCLREKDLVGGL